jgi:ABC-type Fe3+ transport system permease subunit
MCAVFFGLHEYFDQRYLAVLPIMDNPNGSTLTPSQESDARCGDWANDCLFLAALSLASTVVLGMIYAWAWLRRRLAHRGFDVIQ